MMRGLGRGVYRVLGLNQRILMTSKRRINVLVVAGEPSGDAHGAKLVSALRSQYSDVDWNFFGAAGPELRSAGVVPIVESDAFAIIGLPEILRALPMFLSAFGKLKSAATLEKPDIAILIDFPEFNLKLAKSLHRRGVKVVYYISPQLWAWRKYRIRTIKRHVDRLLSILPFEKDWYSSRGVEHVDFVGNPTVSEMPRPISQLDARSALRESTQNPLVALLPGSRQKEVLRILPTMLSAAKAMLDRDPNLQFLIAMAPSRKEEEVAECLRRAGLDASAFGSSLKSVFGRTHEALAAADVAAVASGTATLEAGVIGTPLVVVYRSTTLNYLLLRPLVSIDQFGLVNLVAGKSLAKEMLQFDFTSEALAEELQRLLQPDVNRVFRNELREAMSKLVSESPSEVAARSIGKLLEI